MYKNNYSYYNNQSNERFFALPFLFGALTGGVAVGALNGLNNNKVYYAPMPNYYYGYYYPYY